MASVKLKIKTSQVLKDGSHPIIIQVLKDTKKAITTLQLSCFLDDWDTKTNLPKNRRLSIICQKKLLEIEELLFEGVDKNWSAKKIVNIYKGKELKELMFFKYQSSIQIDGKLGNSTAMVDVTKLNKFKKYLGGKDVSFNDLDYKLLKDYKKSLDDEGLKSATRYLSIIRQVYNYAIEYDDYVPKTNPFKSSLFKKKITSTTQNRNLSKEQVKKLLGLKYGNSWQKPFKNVALDLWKLCFFMRGLNMIELAVMRPKDIKGEYFEFTREKLKNKVNTKQKVKIFPEARHIIDKYLDSNNEYVFPLLENGFNKDEDVQHYIYYRHRLSTINSNLRKIGSELNTKFNMTTMSARYTFINLAKQNEVPFLYLQELIGHKTLTTTDVYLDVFPQSKIDEYHRKVIDSVLT